MGYKNTKETKKVLGVHSNTLRRWESEGKIKAIRGPGGHRLYDVSSVMRGARRNVVYARVSSAGQKDDLESQIAYLRKRYPEHDIIQDIGSGLNYKRKGLNSLLESVMSGTVGEVVIAHKDRLCRFGFEFFEKVFESQGTRIVVLDDTKASPQEELVKDLLSIVHVFSCRLHGLRKYSGRIKEDKDLPGRKKPGETP